MLSLIAFASLSANAVTVAESSSESESSSIQARNAATFAALDTDHDHYISRNEAERGNMGELVHDADRNGDGRVDSNEFASALNARSGQGSEALQEGRSNSTQDENAAQHQSNSTDQKAQAPDSTPSSMGQSSETGRSRTP
jgi:hypothetical protein